VEIMAMLISTSVVSKCFGFVRISRRFKLLCAEFIVMTAGNCLHT